MTFLKQIGLYPQAIVQYFGVIISCQFTILSYSILNIHNENNECPVGGVGSLKAVESLLVLKI